MNQFKPRKTMCVLAICVITLLTPAAPSYAWWGVPISPGDHVIDLERLQKNAQIYAEKVQEYLNQANILINRAIMQTGVNGLDRRIHNAIEKYSKRFYGESATNPDKPLTDYDKMLAKIDDAGELNDFRKSVSAKAQMTRIDSLDTAQQNLTNMSGRLDSIVNGLIQASSEKSDFGYVGQVQLTNGINIARAKNNIDAANNYGAGMVARMEGESEALVEESIERATGPMVGVPSYDPYHPNEKEKAIFEETSTNVGFGHFTGGE